MVQIMENMKSFVQQLEGKSARNRKRVILEYLATEKLPHTLHRYREWFIPTDNIIVTKPGKSTRQILLLSHYDTYHCNPGANDNASSIAVALNVLTRLWSETTYCTIKTIVFDDEEPSPLRPRPCLGSRKYVARFGVQDVAGVFCLEMCGLGDTVVIWPVSESDEGNSMLSAIFEALSGIPTESIPKLPGFTSDFMPFRKAGVSESFCMSAAPSKERDELLRLFSSPILKLLFQAEIPKMIGINKHLPEMIRYYHTKYDTAEHISDTSLQMMADALYKAVVTFDKSVCRSSESEC